LIIDKYSRGSRHHCTIKFTIKKSKIKGSYEDSFLMKTA